MLDNVKDFGRSVVLSDIQSEQGNKLFLYLQCCLTGHAYPTGDLSESLRRNLPVEIYRCLVSQIGKNGDAGTF